MIIVRLIGGLGNQMFQYALGRRLADGLRVPLKLDVTPFRSYVLHRYALWALNIREQLATDREISCARVGRFPTVRRRLRRVLPRAATESPRVVLEKAFRFDASVLDAADGSYLEGYWQSDKYFSPVEERLRVEFSVRSPLGGRDLAIAEKMQEGNSVSVHVRRADYVSDPTRVLGTCDEGYYAQAFEYLGERIEQPKFFVFSDEPDWARTHLRIPLSKTFVCHNDARRNFEDLRLMSLCRHHVIANSTFSWWGAWLGANPSKIVVMPKRWFPDRDPDETTDIRPASWIAL